MNARRYARSGFDGRLRHELHRRPHNLEEGTEFLKRLKKRPVPSGRSRPADDHQLLARVGSSYMEHFSPDKLAITSPAANRRSRCRHLAKGYYAGRSMSKPEEYDRRR